MPGQTVVTIRDKQWECAVANTPQELVSGLSGVESIPPGTGMLFDMGWDCPVIDIYTDEMIFSLDIIFINSAYGVIEVLRNVRPGDEAIFQGEPGAGFFLEINAGEAEGIEVGDSVLFHLGEEVSEAPSWITGLIGLIGFVAMGFFMVRLSRELVKEALEEPEKKPALLPQVSSRQRAAMYEIETDRMGNIIITRTDAPGKDVFLQFESDKSLVYDLLKKGERRDLGAGWEIRIKRSEPRASILDELWESSAQPQKMTATIEGKPTGTCYADAWRFLIKEGEGELIHGTVFSGNRRIGHAWVKTSTGWIWEPETGRYFTRLGFRDSFAPIIESRYTAEEAAIMAARAKNLGPWTEQERRRYLKDKSPAVIPEHKRQPRLKGELEFLPDSPEFLAYTIEDIGYREKIDSAFLNAIARAKRGR